jgi:hypothetical protein
MHCPAKHPQTSPSGPPHRPVLPFAGSPGAYREIAECGAVKQRVFQPRYEGL